MTKWGVLTRSNQAVAWINHWTAQLLSESAYDRIILPAIFTMIIGVTRKWNGIN
jgi:hypothetical protein